MIEARKYQRKSVFSVNCGSTCCRRSYDSYDEKAVLKVSMIALLYSLLSYSTHGFTSLQKTCKLQSITDRRIPSLQTIRRFNTLFSAVVSSTEGAAPFEEEINGKKLVILEASTAVTDDRTTEAAIAEATTTSGNIGTSTEALNTAAHASTTLIPRIWPCNDDLDRRLIILSLPVIANFAIGPLIGAVDLFWVNRMGDALAVAGQAASNQVFNSVFWLTSFLPSVTATLIAKENAKNNTDGVQDAVCQALVVGVFMALVSSVVLLVYPNQVLGSVLPAGAPALRYAKPYLLIRSFAFIPALISLVGFSAFRGILDTVTPVKISLFANVFNCILDPILIFNFGMGVPGGESRWMKDE
jgi:MatE